MQVEPEAYHMEYNGLVIRLYVQEKEVGIS